MVQPSLRTGREARLVDVGMIRFSMNKERTNQVTYTAGRM